MIAIQNLIRNANRNKMGMVVSKDNKVIAIIRCDELNVDSFEGKLLQVIEDELDVECKIDIASAKGMDYDYTVDLAVIIDDGDGEPSTENYEVTVIAIY